MKRLLSLVLGIVMVGLLAACAGDTPPSESISQTSVAAPGVPSSESLPPPPPPEPLNQAYLTGLAKDASYPEGKRITAVMMNNVPDSRPQEGISEAKVLIEIKVEYNVTRFMALFEDYAALPRVGGIRSARDQFFQLLIPTQGFYIHDGPSAPTHPVNVMMHDFEYDSLDLYGEINISRDPSRGTSIYHWEYVNGDIAEAAVLNYGFDDYRTYNSPIFHFVSYNEAPRVPAEGTAMAVEVGHAPPYYVSYFDYDAASGKYNMSMHNSFSGQRQNATDANNGAPLSFDNVIVLLAPFSIWPDTAPENLPKVDYTQGGGGFYFSKGGWERFIWRKGSANLPLQLYNFNNQEELLQINTGTTYLAVLDDKLSDDFYQTVLSGTAGQSAGAVGGDANVPVD